jgi:hypothetical protein
MGLSSTRATPSASKSRAWTMRVAKSGGQHSENFGTSGAYSFAGGLI